MRADIARYYPGRSLGDVFSGRITPDECWDFITHLPRESATWAAVYDDPLTVLDDTEREIPLTQYSPEVELLTDVYDAISALRAQVAALTSKTPVKIAPHRRPGEGKRAQLEARRREQARQEWGDLLAQMGIEG